MAPSPLRYKRLIQALPKNNYNVKKSAIEAGFSESTADKSGKRLVKAALKHEAQELVERLDNTPMTKPALKQFMSEIVGLSREDVMSNLKWLANQEKDLGVRLKVVAPLAKDYGVILQAEDENKVNVPILNVVVKEKGENMAQQSDKIQL